MVAARLHLIESTALHFSMPLPRRTMIVPLLLLGSMINLGIAWLCTACVEIGGSRSTDIRNVDEVQEVEVIERWLGRSRVNIARFSELTRDADGNIQIARWSSDGHERSELLAGCPMRSFSCTNHGEIDINLGSSRMGMNKSGLNPIQGGIELSPLAGVGVWRALPYRPLWFGLIVNTLFWSIVAWLLMAAPAALRRHRRLRRGLCVACGYNLSGAMHDVCPECGSG